MITQQELRRFAAPSYIAAASLILFPIFDQLMQLVPTAKLHDARWRFGAVGLMSNLFVLTIAGLLIAFLMSAALEHRVFQRVMAVLCAAAALALIMATGLFALDAIQVRSLMRPEAWSSWGVATLTAVGKFAVAIVALAWFAVAGFRSSKPSKPVSHARGPGLVMGATTSRPAAAGESKS